MQITKITLPMCTLSTPFVDDHFIMSQAQFFFFFMACGLSVHWSDKVVTVGVHIMVMKLSII